MAGTRSKGEPASAAEHRAWLPFHVMAKPIGPICNLDCSYCFYLDKRALYPETRSFRMSPETLERFVEQTIAAAPPGAGEVQFAWQGGEPTLMGVGFFEQVVSLQARHAPPGVRVENALQTNGTLLDDAWGRLLAEHDFLVGVSVDGPRAVHDRHRPDGAGRGSFDDVLRGIDVLKRYGVAFNTLTVLHGENSDDPVGLYDFLKRLGSTHLQLIPVVEHGGALETLGQRSISPRQWGDCLNGVFDRWLACGDVGRIFVQHFDVMLGVALGHESAHCVHQERCGRAVALEHNGDLYSCDHFVEPAHRLGNLSRSSLLELVESPAQRAFGDAKRDTLPRYCLNCSHLRYCWGACPKDRIARAPDGEAGLHYLCEGYKQFYAHTRPVFEKMAAAVRSGRPARDWRAATAGPPEPPAAARSKVGRNTPCPCGSGLKYKRCCGRQGS